MTHKPTTSNAALRMDEAKRRFTAAARAALAGDPEAPALAREAYADVQRAREQLTQARSELAADIEGHQMARTLTTIDGPESER